MSTPKVSIIIPCYNVEKYLRECLDSVVNQTLRDIQIICVNDGSTDGTLSILKEYAARDNRILIIDKSNSGYGNSMNKGLDAADGEYIGIVESDDFAEPNMFELLYHAAVQNDLDVVKSGFYQYSTTPEISNVPELSVVKNAGKKVFCPMTDFRSSGRKANFFKATAAIWSAIYRTKFIRDNDIRFNETPGASYQDIGFCFKVWTKAKRVQILDTCLLHYRVDNSQSSVHNPGKIYCVCDEYAEIDRFLKKNPSERAAALPVMLRIKYENYLWNYERLAEHLREEFLYRFYDEFRQHQQDGTLKKEYFSWYDWNTLQKLLLDPARFHEIHSKKLKGEWAPDFYDVYPQQRPIKIKSLYSTAEKAAVVMKQFGTAGVHDTFNLLLAKSKQKFAKKPADEREKV